MAMVVYIRKDAGVRNARASTYNYLLEKIPDLTRFAIVTTFVEFANEINYDFSNYGKIILCEINAKTNQIILKFSDDPDGDHATCFPIPNDDTDFKHEVLIERIEEMKKRFTFEGPAEDY